VAREIHSIAVVTLDPTRWYGTPGARQVNAPHTRKTACNLCGDAGGRTGRAKTSGAWPAKVERGLCSCVFMKERFSAMQQGGAGEVKRLAWSR